MPVGSDLILILIVVLIIVLLVRGPKNLPKLGESLGQSISGFRRAVKEDDDPSKATQPSPTPRPPPWLHQSARHRPRQHRSNPSRPSLRPHRKRRLLQIRRRARSTAGRRPDARSASLP